MASFRGHSFREGGNGNTTFPVWSRNAQIAVLDVPGANTSIVQRFGRVSDRVGILATMTGAELNTIMGDVGQSGSLSFHWGSFTAVLENIDGAQETLTADLYTATLNFIRM